MKRRRPGQPYPIEEGWKDKYDVKQNGFYSWAAFSKAWHSVRPMRRVSPWFGSKQEAEAYMNKTWLTHIANKMERALLS